MATVSSGGVIPLLRLHAPGKDVAREGCQPEVAVAEAQPNQAPTEGIAQQVCAAVEAHWQDEQDEGPQRRNNPEAHLCLHRLREQGQGGQVQENRHAEREIPTHTPSGHAKGLEKPLPLYYNND